MLVNMFITVPFASLTSPSRKYCIDIICGYLKCNRIVTCRP
jgi:hypothetical protein